MTKYKKIAIFGAGYVGMSLAVMFSQKISVSVIDSNNAKVRLLNQKISPIGDELIETYLKDRELLLEALNKIPDLKTFDLIILALPTNFQDSSKSFDTSIIENVIEQINSAGYMGTILIKATVPIGFTDIMKNSFNRSNIIFSPEFLREGYALEDNLNPSRIIIGDKTDEGRNLGELFHSFTHNSPEVIFMTSSEAEAVKLFSNTFLALRVGFFNELDNFCLGKNLSSKDIIKGLSEDPRIGDTYNNPSFGYGGYCLPKDTRQLEASFSEIPQSLISAVITSNQKRKEFIAKFILDRNPSIIGVYRLLMKENSDNFREAAVYDLIQIFRSHKIKVIIYEPLEESSSIYEAKLINSLEEFKKSASIIIANRYHKELNDVFDKVITRDTQFHN